MRIRDEGFDTMVQLVHIPCSALIEITLSVFIVSNWPELFLFFAIDIACFVEVGFEFLRLGVEVIAQRFERVKFLVPEQHIDARY